MPLPLQQQNIGFGDPDFTLAVYVEKRPPMEEYRNIDGVMPLQGGEIDMINQASGNGWRKLFNVYAKLVYALPPSKRPPGTDSPRWQTYRDTALLQPGGKTALLFSEPQLKKENDNRIHIMAGRTHAKAFLATRQDLQVTWLDDEFAVARNERLLVCPYFDYRQLSNIKIERLSALFEAL